MSVIHVRHLSKQYEYYRKHPGVWGSLRSFFHRETLYADAVKDISFDIEQGELVGFLGPNGAGKTTTLKILSGILHPTSGEATVLGHTPSDLEEAYQKQFALVMGQKNQLVSDLPAIESFVLTKEIYEVPDDVYAQTLHELVTLLQIETILDIPIRKLSLGQRMKCELVAALLHNPKVLFLDEPTIGLDVVAQKNIRDFLKTYNKKKKTTIILTSHYMDDIRELCDRVIIINLGGIVYDGNLNELIRKHSPSKLLQITFHGAGISREELERYGDIHEINSAQCTLRIPRDEAKRVAANLLSSALPIDDILIHEANVDDVVRHIFTDKP